MSKEKPKCLVTDCVRKAVQRGVCNACRSNFSAAINRGRITEEELVAAGLMLPVAEGYAKRGQSPAFLAICKLKEGKQ